ncbi:MAG: DEAD/DEAH box helicase [Pyrinomonadaceae bacterium]
MPNFSKKSLSLFLRNGCERQFILSLYNDTERKTHSLPPRQTTRAGLGLVAAAGYEWQDEKVAEVKDVFGSANVHMTPVFTGKRPQPIDLAATVLKVVPYQFVVEGKYDADTPAFRASFGIGTFNDYYGNNVSIGSTQPDIIQVLPPVSSVTAPTGATGRDAYRLEVRPDGQTLLLDSKDDRLRLRVIDVKLTSQPGAYYFAETVYYSVTLAAWLVENKLDDRFVVIAASAVWPGSHKASNLAQQMEEWRKRAYLPSAEEMCTALEEDLEIAPFEVFVPPLHRLLTQQLPIMLTKPWQDLTWHVDFRCKGCEFLGYPWVNALGIVDNDPTQCWPTAETTGHLSQIVGLSRGATKHLREVGVADVSSLATTAPASGVFDEHLSLRSKRAIFPARATTLGTKSSSVIPNSGGDALMPRYPNLHIYVFLDYDLSSAITAAIGIRAFWTEPLPFGSTLTRNSFQWTATKGADEVFLVDSRSLPREQTEFLKFLRHLKGILRKVVQFDTDDVGSGRRDQKTEHSTYQIYLWDESQRQHLVRLIGRHLPHILADPDLRDLAWLFPPPELLQAAEDATRKSPITVVSTVINNTVTIPVPHHYPLLEVVKTYLPSGMTGPEVHPLYEEPMSDLLPSERIHEWWQRIGKWHEKQDIIRETSRKKVLALNLVTSRLETDLKDRLSRLAAPPVIRAPRQAGGLAPQSLLWLEYTRLNNALSELEVHSDRAMPPHEREARGKSARLKRRLSGVEEANALSILSATLGRIVASSPDLFVYEMRPTSSELNARPGDIGYALSPELDTSTSPPRPKFGFLDEHPMKYVAGTSLEKLGRRRSHETFETLKLTEVSIEAIDRNHGLIALRGGPGCAIVDLDAEPTVPLDFSQNVVLDKAHHDYLTAKIKLTLAGIAYPAGAVPDTRTLVSLGLPIGFAAGTSPDSPASELLWEITKIQATPTSRNITAIRPVVESFLNSRDVKLDLSQWHAWEGGLSRRFSMIWGPPGTGKSRTLRAIILGAVQDAVANGKNLRLLITANTYTALDNVLLEAERELSRLFPVKPFDIYRISSHWKGVDPDLSSRYPSLIQLQLSPSRPSTEVKDLVRELTGPAKITIVGALPQQLHNLAVAGVKTKQPAHTQKQWFDFVVLDEASQIDIATSTLIFTKLAAGATCVLAGDDLQLPPIHNAEPPLELDYLVGSAYNYFRFYQGVLPNALDVNYRSNKTIVELTKVAGYSSTLTSNSPELKLHLLSLIPVSKPTGFPSNLVWTPDLVPLIDADYSTACFIYDDDSSSQSNDFEADNVASLIWLLSGNMSDKLLNERKPDGTIDVIPSTIPYTPADFWDKAIGVVTPHRAQMSKIVARLQSIFPTHNPETIRSAVDTVERFQGQQRDIIIASFGLGDPDLISAEAEFIFNLNRFNVMTSRSRAKLIVFVTRSLLDHLSNDKEVLEESRFVKQFAESFCLNPQPSSLGFFKRGTATFRNGVIRRR